MTCEFPWCDKQARSIASGLCGTHYEQGRLSKEPQLPVEPLLRFAERRDLFIEDLNRGQRTLGLARADEIACKVLKVHPAAIWGPEWFLIPTYDDTELEAAA